LPYLSASFNEQAIETRDKEVEASIDLALLATEH
jgi:hypothetical protein